MSTAAGFPIRPAYSRNGFYGAPLQSSPEGPNTSGSASTPRSHFQLQPEEQQLWYRPQPQQPLESQSILSRLEAMEAHLRTLTALINQPREPEVVTTRSCRIPPVLSVCLFNYHTNVALTVMLVDLFHTTETSEGAPLCAGCTI